MGGCWGGLRGLQLFSPNGTVLGVSYSEVVQSFEEYEMTSRTHHNLSFQNENF